jgi:hypothetical protein
MNEPPTSVFYERHNFRSLEEAARMLEIPGGVRMIQEYKYA